MAAVLCTTPYENLKEKFKENKKFDLFKRKDSSILRYFTGQSLYDVKNLKELLRDNIGDMSFQVL